MWNDNVIWRMSQSLTALTKSSIQKMALYGTRYVKASQHLRYSTNFPNNNLEWHGLLGNVSTAVQGKRIYNGVVVGRLPSKIRI